MSESAWMVRAAFAVTATTVVLAGCSSNSSSPEPAVTVTETAAAPSASAPATTQATTPADSQPTPPSGATKVDSADESGMQYTRYKISGTSAEDVVTGYEEQFKALGYTITNAGGSGGGWGQWGGDGYGMDANMGDSFASVQAGGSTSGPTYFEVCLGSDKSVVDQCGEQSQNEESDSNSKGS